MRDYSKIANDNITLITSIREYIYKLFSITQEEFNTSSRKYIKELLYSIKKNNLKMKYIRLKREKLREDIRDLEASFVVGDSYDKEFTGKNNGLQPNTTEIKYLKRAKLKEELGKLVVETLEIEKSLEDNNKLVCNLIDLLPSEAQTTILKMTYINCMSNVEIAAKLCYSVDGIDMARHRGIRELNKLLRF